MDLGFGELFGEDMLCFNVLNTYSIRIESTSAVLLYIDRSEFIKKYKRIVLPMQKYFTRRKKLIDKIINNLEAQQREIKKQFYSKIERGKLSVYLMKELKMQLQHANPIMKKKLHRHYLKM